MRVGGFCLLHVGEYVSESKVVRATVGSEEEKTFEAPPRKSAEKHKRKEQQINNMECVLVKKCETIFMCATREEKIGAGTVKAFWFSHFDCPSQCVLDMRI